MGTTFKDLALFFVFLAEEGATAQFFENWVPNDPFCRACSDIVGLFTLWVQRYGVAWDSYITSSFRWGCSLEGPAYWSDLNFKWLSYYGTVCK